MISNLPMPFLLRLRAFQAVVLICLLFVVLTVAAMVVYPGGTVLDKSAKGYQFFNNFFSELGMTQTYSDTPNTISNILFTTALVFAGLALVAFFTVFASFFTRSAFDQFLAWSGSFFGIIAGCSFMGIALTPIDINLEFHLELVQLAFRTFWIAVVFYLVPLVRERRHPRLSTWAFFVFAILLGAYVLLISVGPGYQTDEGLFIQATGQKIIVYACIISILIEAVGSIIFINESGRY